MGLVVEQLVVGMPADCLVDSMPAHALLDVWIVSDRLQCDVLRSLVNKAVADIALGLSRRQRRAAQFALLLASLGGVASR